MEKQLFSWEGIDIQCAMCFTFYDCVLNVKVGDHEPGTKVKSIDMDYENGVMEFYNDAGDTVLAKFNLSLDVEVA